MICKCEKAINIMRCLTGCSWGAGRNLMTYGSAAKSTMAKLDVVHARDLRLCTGAPILVLLVETREAPLRL